MQQEKQPTGSELQLIICGADGHMGQAVVEAVHNTPDLHITAGVVAPHSAKVGKQAQQNFPLHGTLSHALQQTNTTNHVVLDFSVADACATHAQACQQHQVAYVTGVTGLQPAQHRALQQASQTVPVLHAANMSLGVNVLHILCCLAAQLLPDADVEISELHHRHKRDHPSGTALWIAQAIAKHRGWPANCVTSQQRQNVRQKREIGIASLRGGYGRGAHTIHMLLQDESLQLTHRAVSRTAYAQGALLACKYVANQPAGQYSMQNVLKSFFSNNMQHLLDFL